MKNTYNTPCFAATLAIALLFSGCDEAQRNTRATQTGQTQPVVRQTPAPVSAAATRPAATTEAKPIAAVQAVSSPYAPYHVEVPLSGYLRSIGSDTMDELFAALEAELGRFQTGLRFRHEGKGSSTAMPALLEERSDVGPMSRVMKSAESISFEEKFGYKATQLPVAIDTLAVYVHPDNPILKTGLSLEQVAAIFSQSEAPIERWGQLGLTGKWTNAPIRLHGRNPASGTHAFFKSHALNKGSFRDSLTEYEGSSEVVRHVGMDPYGIGYSGIAYKTADVDTVPLKSKNGAYAKPNQANAAGGVYPLTRSLYITLNIDPSVGPSDLQKEFVRFVYSREGQKTVEKVGYFPVDPKLAQRTLRAF